MRGGEARNRVVAVLVGVSLLSSPQIRRLLLSEKVGIQQFVGAIGENCRYGEYDVVSE